MWIRIRCNEALKRTIRYFEADLLWWVGAEMDDYAIKSDTEAEDRNMFYYIEIESLQKPGMIR